MQMTARAGAHTRHRAGSVSGGRRGGQRAAAHILLLTVMLVTVVLAATYPGYRDAMRRGRERLPSRALMATRVGAVEYADVGQGPAVLIVHGAGGGCDQGLLVGETFLGDSFRFIAPSRFGYLGSPVLGDGTPAAQADAYAALLDQLEVGSVVVVAISDGGPSALQFALRHPQRISALLMMSAKSQTPPATTPLQEAVFEMIFRSDYLYWAVSTTARPYLLAALGVPGDVQDASTAEAQSLIATVTDGMNPISLRRAGIYHDRASLSRLPPDAFPLEQISTPTLVVHAKDDGLQSFAHALHTARRIPGARLLAYEHGGHLLTLQIEDARQQMRAFVAGESGFGRGE